MLEKLTGIGKFTWMDEIEILESVRAMVRKAIGDPDCRVAAGRPRLQECRRWVCPASRLDPGAGAVFAVAKKDPVSGEPIYDPRVVKGYRTNRQRMVALNRVYGPKIRGRSAGRAIFESGETRAASVESAAANLNVLAKHRTGEFVRDSGTYTYRGELEPDLEMIALVTGESGSAGELKEGARMVESQDQNADGVESTSLGAATGA